MAEPVKLTFPANGLVVVVPDNQVREYKAVGWVELKPEAKESTDAKPKPRRRSTSAKTTNSKRDTKS